MIKHTFLERSIFQDIIPEISFIDNKIISNSILNDFLSIKENNFNKFKDVNIFSTQHIIWVCDYVRDHVLLHYGFNFVLKETFAQIQFINESSVKRNHIDINNLEHSPMYTMLYFPYGDDGKIIIECPSFNNQIKEIEIPIEIGKLVVFNSDLNYYLTSNNKDKFRITLISTFFIL